MVEKRWTRYATEIPHFSYGLLKRMAHAARKMLKYAPYFSYGFPLKRARAARKRFQFITHVSQFF